MSTQAFSVNERAGELLGFRPTDVVPFDQPCELGYRCPVCLVEPRQGTGFDERLEWSEYVGFLWCAVCNKDYPSALCVPLDGEDHPERYWERRGVDSAIEIFLDQIEMAQQIALERAGVEGHGGDA